MTEPNIHAEIYAKLKAETADAEARALAWATDYSKVAAERDELRAALAQQSMQLAHDSVTIDLLNDKVMRLAHPAPREPMTPEKVRAVGGIVHSDGNVFFTNLAQLNEAIGIKEKSE